MREIKGEALLTFTYTFTLADKTHKFVVNIDRATMNIILPELDDPPNWAKLEYHQCSNCPLETGIHPYCPAALTIIDLIKFFSRSTSWKKVSVKIETNERTYWRHTDLQNAVSSLLGLCLATSECPILGQLRPMARFHLPFQSIEESTYRAISMYLLGQYYKKARGLEPDWDLNHLSEIYENIQTVNHTFKNRLSGIGIGDASLNAMVILDNYANYVLFEIDEGFIAELENLYKVYFKD
ncbi:DUF6901 family protein [candidate division KSB1 bacterium]